MSACISGKLLSRQAAANAWNDVYETGGPFVSDTLSQNDTSENAQTIQSVFALSASVKAKSTLNTPAFLNQPMIHDLLTHAQAQVQQSPGDLNARLIALELDPLSKLPPLPKKNPVHLYAGPDHAENCLSQRGLVLA